MHQYRQSLEFDRVISLIERYVKTEGGMAALRSLGECPGVPEIKKRFALINDIREFVSAESRFYFDNVADQRDALRGLRIEGYQLETAALYRLALSLRTITEIRGHIHKKREKFRFLFEAVRAMGSFEKVYREILRCVEKDGSVKDEASPALLAVRREITSLSSRIQSKLKDIIGGLKSHIAMPEDYVTVREGRFVMPLPSSQQGRVKGIVHDYSQSHSTLFVEPLSVLNENNSLRELRDREAAEIGKIIGRLNDMVRPEAQSMCDSLESAFALDASCAIAAFASSKRCEAVEVSEEGGLEIVNGRHPLLDDNCVPLNLKISSRHDILILSGPNAGGKTVLLKSIGLFCLMVRMGVPIPADPSSVIPLIDRMFVDIGDSQSISENLSTFSGHVKFLASMIDGIADPRRTLVLLDELGSGSAPNYSSAIACAVIWHLSRIRVRSVVTTHFSGVVDFAYSLENAVNGSLEFDAATLSPTYRLIMGVPGASYAIHIARNYGLQPFIVDKAMEFLDRNETRYEELISELVKFSSGLKEEYQKVTIESEKLKKTEQRFVNLEKAFTRTREEVVEELREEYEKKYNEMLAKVNALAASREKSSREGAPSDGVREKRIELTRMIAEEKKTISDGLQAPEAAGEQAAADSPLPRKSFPYKIGDQVLVEKFNSKGVVKEIDFRKRQARLEFRNKMLMWIKFSLISGTSDNLSEFEDRGTISVRTAEVEITHELDIRGKTCEQGVADLEAYLIRAAEKRLKSVRIIHGKGTLALKAAVEDYLRRSSLARSFRAGKYGEGDYGVTVVELG